LYISAVTRKKKIVKERKTLGEGIETKLVNRIVDMLVVGLSKVRGIGGS
jgi:hypothetical protein